MKALPQPYSIYTLFSINPAQRVSCSVNYTLASIQQLHYCHIQFEPQTENIYFLYNPTRGNIQQLVNYSTVTQIFANLNLSHMSLTQKNASLVRHYNEKLKNSSGAYFPPTAVSAVRCLRGCEPWRVLGPRARVWGSILQSLSDANTDHISRQQNIPRLNLILDIMFQNSSRRSSLADINSGKSRGDDKNLDVLWLSWQNYFVRIMFRSLSFPYPEKNNFNDLQFVVTRHGPSLQIKI